MEFTDELKELGFIDPTKDKNGGAVRKSLPGGVLELCQYRYETNLRLQTTGGGFTIVLQGIKTPNDVKQLWQLITGEELRK